MARKATKAVARGGRPSRADALRLRERILVAGTEAVPRRGLRLDHHRGGGEARARVQAHLLRSVRRQAGAVRRGGPSHHRAHPASAGGAPARGRRRCRTCCAALPDSSCAQRCLRRPLRCTGWCIAESGRFPELVRAVASDGSTSEGIALISSLLERELPESRLRPEDRAFAAQQFIFMVVSSAAASRLGIRCAHDGSPNSRRGPTRWSLCSWTAAATSAHEALERGLMPAARQRALRRGSLCCPALLPHSPGATRATR